MWLRYNENNSGSNRLGKPQNTTNDIGLRRSRFLMFAQLNKRFLVLTHFGINNQNAISGGYLGTDGKKPQLYMRDAVQDLTGFPYILPTHQGRAAERILYGFLGGKLKTKN